MNRTVAITGATSVYLLLVLLAIALPARAQDRVLNVYNWTDYIDSAALQRFEKETGVKVNYDVYDSLETLEAKLLTGHSGYDIVVPSDEPSFSRLIRAGAVAPIDHASVLNWRNLDPGLMQRVASADPGNAHGAIYLYGSTGLGIEPDRIRALAPDAPLDSWDLLLKPENAKRLAACGIIMLDFGNRRDPVGAALSGKRPGQYRCRRPRGGRTGADAHPSVHS